MFKPIFCGVNVQGPSPDWQDHFDWSTKLFLYFYPGPLPVKAGFSHKSMCVFHQIRVWISPGYFHFRTCRLSPCVLSCYNWSKFGVIWGPPPPIWGRCLFKTRTPVPPPPPLGWLQEALLTGDNGMWCHLVADLSPSTICTGVEWNIMIVILLVMMHYGTIMIMIDLSDTYPHNPNKSGSSF